VRTVIELKQSDELHQEASAAAPNVSILRKLIDSIMAGIPKSDSTAGGAIVVELGHEATKAIADR
jgi:hypothetical protein